MNKKVALYILPFIGAGAFCLGVSASKTQVGAETANIKSITIDLDLGTYNAEELPFGIQGCTYPVFDYTAKDNLGNEIKDVEVLAYYDVNSDTDRGIFSDDKLIAIQDGRFATDSAGQYVIEYTATAQSVRKSVRLYVTVLAEDKYVESSYVLNDELVSITEVYTGNKISLFEGLVNSDSRFGNADVSVEIAYEGDYESNVGDLTIVDCIDCEDYFKPIVAGQYTISYTVENILGADKSVTTTHTVNVVDDTVPILSEPIFSPVLYVGQEATFPVVEAVQYYKGKQVYVPVRVFFNEEDVTANRSFTPTESGGATLSYVATSLIDGTSQSRNDYNLFVYDMESEEDLFISKYFYFEGFDRHYFELPKGNGKDKTVTDEETGVVYSESVYTVTTQEGVDNASVVFGRATHVEYLELEFAIEQELCGFENLYVIFTDSKDAEKRVEVRLTEVIESETNRYVEVYLNGVYVKRLENKCFSEFANASFDSKFYIKYDSLNKTLVDKKGNAICALTSYTNGEAFGGFESGKAYISIKIDNVTEKSRLRLSSFATQVLNANTGDKTSPVFVGNNSGRIVADINTNVIIKYPEVFDALDDDIKMKIKILKSTGEIVLDTYITEDYSYYADTYGSFMLVYTAYDSAGNSREKKSSIKILDRIAPQIELMSKMSEKVTKGESYTFPIFKATDNADAECATWISVSYGNFKNLMVADGKFTFAEEGTYTVKFNAVDLSGNYCIVSYTVVCE